jgi:hypothetical protein
MRKLRYIIFALGLLALTNYSTAQVDSTKVTYDNITSPTYISSRDRIVEFTADTLRAQLMCTECDSCQLKVIVGYVVQTKDASVNLFTVGMYLDKNKQPLDSNICVLISRILR